MRALFLVLLTAPAAADPLHMHYVEGTNLHIANQQGAINWHADVTATLDLGANQKAELASKGTRGEHNLYADGRNTDDDATWTATWRGTYTQSASTLKLQLALVKDDCKAQRIETNPDRPAEKRACRATAPKVTLTCTSTDVNLEELAKAKATVWMCSGDHDVGETPIFAFGRDRCVEVLGGRQGNSYRGC